ncbi:LuxR C-terminal-related transcriptional regulator [Deinococcus alpinitundrae]|uniref:LuxR C-terminal-related transcriptional regulator n=1 Tax=Deinococcus alpinitundrae TaxID=468913 RepID=UPI0013793CE3|nr:LuxR C-terminal-related transcriptional regulator [Deinococcus alpinitundrae]
MTPILATKLHMPLSRQGRVRRLSLIQRLNEGLQGKMTLISAPAGFGKTTLLCEWIAGSGRPAAWLSLDDGDNAPVRFLVHLIAALQTVAPGIGSRILAALQSVHPPPVDAILPELLHDLGALPHAVILVLDDYHVLDAPQLHAALSFLLDHLPPQLHLAVATREDPDLPLARLRVQGQLTELRAADLRFALPEVTEFLNRMMALGLSEANVAVLDHRTEGWIAGLQLAALSMQGRENLPAFIEAFAGDHRFIVDYLMEEVLRRQPEDVRTFLLHTSILERLCGSLCNAVTGQTGGSARLEALERGNFFVVPLDDRRHWYRYHHLFADFLQMHLQADQPGGVPALHRQASVWFESEASAADAIRHALAAKDVERAADLIERAVPALRRSRQEATALDWLRVLPDLVVRRRPVLSVYYAGGLLMGGQREGVEERLLDAQRWLDGTQMDAAPPMVVVDQDEFRGLGSLIALYRAAMALSSGHFTETVTQARRVLDLVPAGDEFKRGAASGLMGLALWADGYLEEAHQSYLEAMAGLHRAGYRSDAVGCAVAVADLELEQGHLHLALATYERGLHVAMEGGGLALRGAADMHVGLSALACERGDLKAATQHLSRSRELGEFLGLPQNRFRWCRTAARIKEIQGDLDGALDLLNEAQRLYVSDFFPEVRPIAALRARIWIKQGKVEDALAWATAQHLSTIDLLTYLREFEHITLARLLLSQEHHKQTNPALLQAINLLERFLYAAKDGGRTRSVSEILVLQALAYRQRGDGREALTRLEAALKLAMPERNIRIFVDEGAPMAVMLKKFAKQGSTVNAVWQLLKAFENAGNAAAVNPSSLETLSERELEVLRLLQSELTGPELARTLAVSLNTLRTHTKNIYSKLGVNTRRAALRRAHELELI